MLPPRRLVDYPWVVVRLDCTLCDRYGAYKLAWLAGRYGPEIELDYLLSELAHNCPWWRSRPRCYEVRCGARFLDLERALPPADMPPEPVYRRKPPAREDLAPIRTRTGAAPALTLIQALLIRNRSATFLFRVAGDSMVDKGLLDGELAVVDRSLKPQPGNIVVVDVDGERSFKVRGRQNGRVTFSFANPRYPAFVLDDEAIVEVWGVVSGSINPRRRAVRG